MLNMTVETTRIIHDTNQNSFLPSLMTKIIALFNQAGGVGKTTITHNLGYHLSQKGHQVLLIDLDPPILPHNFCRN